MTKAHDISAVTDMDAVKQDILDFARSEDGGVETITLCLWLPTVFSFFMFAADAAYILFSRANMIRVAENSTRLRSMGQLEDEAAVRQAIRNALPRSTPARVTVGNEVTSGVVLTRVSVPLSEIDMFGIVSAIARDTPVTVIVTQFKEDPEA